ncbi:MAG: MBL fold metallo-hydrolase, partial [Myxococcota bacterium]|nr:MBL fold metallo-hydrolase [Myxococcota bacterium]
MPSLFTRDVQVVVLASGSRGNCTYIGDAFCGVLVDCGVSALQVLKRMGQVGLQDAPIDAVLVTHEHSDHVAGAAVLSRRLLKERGSRVPFFMTEGTHRHLNPKVVPDGVEFVEPGQGFEVGHFSVDPFSVPHDTECPVAYRVGIEGQWFGVVTDLGHSTRLVAEKLRTLTTAVLEFNHDTELLLDGPYSWPLKQRIRSA